MSQQIAVQNIPIGKLRNSKFNVRKDVGDISELVLSIKSVGVLEPLIARPVGTEFEVIIGSRRLAASMKAGLKVVPVIVKKLTNEEAILESLVENLQRGDLTEVEIVGAYKLLHGFDPKHWNQESFGKRMGKSHQWVSRLLAAHEAFTKLQEAGVFKSMSSNPSREERARGVAPTTILTEINEAMRSDIVRESFAPPEIEKKTVELGKAVKELNYEDAVRVVERFKMYPEKPVEKVKEEAMAVSAGVALKTYLPPKVARQIEETTGKPIEEGITQVIERGLQTSPLALPEKLQEKGGYATLEEPLSAQFQHQREWNLRQIVGRDLSAKGKRFSFDFLTIGYSQKTMDDLLNSLKAAEAKVLVDVRRNAQSLYRPEFNKEALEKELKAKGIGYAHFPELGIPRELRDEVYGGKTTAKSVLSQYEREVLKKGGLKKLKGTVKGKGTFAIMCTEVDPTNCHRHKIAEALSQEGMVGYDL